MSHGIKGVTHLDIGGHRRTLVCDMNAADVLHDQHGDKWQLWLAAHFIGEQVSAENPMARRFDRVSPSGLINTLYALLASDREDDPREESPETLKRAIGIAEMPVVEVAVLTAVMAGFGLPGEMIEAVAKAAGEPQVFQKSAAAGTGTKS